MLDQTILKGIQQLKNTYPKRPVYILLGAPQTGKSTLLSSQPQLQLLAQDFIEQACWVGDDALYIVHTLPVGSEGHSAAFNALSALLLGLKKRCAGLLLTCPMTTFYPQAAHKNDLADFQALTEQLAQVLAGLPARYPARYQIPIDLVITQADRVVGFAAFFDHLTGKERQQSWGIDVRSKTSTPAKALAELAQGLNQRVVSRMHQEHQALRKIRIKDYPARFAALIKPLTAWIDTFHPDHRAFCLRHIYFTSSHQLSATPQSKYPTVSRTFFTQALFDTHLPQRANTALVARKRSHTAWQIGTIASGVAALCLTGMMSQQHYHQSMVTLKKIEQQMGKPQTQVAVASAPADQHTSSPWELLDQRYQNADVLAHKAENSGLTPLRHTAVQHYQQALINVLLPYVESTLREQLSNTETHDIGRRYQTLRAYLMLHDRAHFNADTINHWFLQYWARQSAPMPPTAAKHLHQLLTLDLPALKLNQRLIEQVRHQLSAHTLPNLALHLVLTDAYGSGNHQPTTMTLPASTGAFTQSANTIPMIYTATAIEPIYREKIPHMSQILAHSQWVFRADDQTAIDTEQLTRRTQVLYLFYYRHHWMQVLQGIAFHPVQDTAHTQQLLEALLNPQGALRQRLAVLLANTQIAGDIPDFRRQVSEHFKDAALLSSALAQGGLHQALAQLNDEFNQITQAKNPGKQAFKTTVKRFASKRAKLDAHDAIKQLQREIKTIALPAPFNAWLTTLPRDAWRVLLHDSHAYINAQWQATIWTPYNATLNHRYPLFKSAKNEASIADFARFFRPHGKIDQFFHTYIAPFVHTQRHHWPMRSIDSQHMPLSSANLELFMRANLIKKMFFSTTKKTPRVQFTMIPVALMPSVRQLHLQMGSEHVHYTHTNAPIHHVTWPMKGSTEMMIQFMDNNGSIATRRETGAWSLFRLLDKASVKKTHDLKRYRLTLDLNGNAAKYELLADSKANPFVQGIVSHFRCPRHLS